MRGLALVAFALSACTPSQSLRPAHALSERDSEMGLGISRIGPRPYVIEPAHHVAQGWWSTKLGERWATSAIVSFDTSGLLAGSALRVDLWRGSSFVASSEIELGFLWAGASLPLSLRVYGDAWLYTSPRIGHWGPHAAPFLPVGVSVPLGAELSLRGELSLSWADFSGTQRRLHSGIAVVQAF